MNFFSHFELPFREPVAVFATVLLLLLFAPFLFRKLRVPGIVGLILSGMLIGPYGLGLLERDASIELFSTIGLLYIMFLAGLELELKEFESHRWRSVVFGLLTFAIPFATGFMVMNGLLAYNTAASVLIGLMMASYTLVAYPIASRLGVHKHPLVMVVVGGTIVADSLVLILLAVVGNGLEGEMGWWQYTRLGLSMVLYLVLIFQLLPRLARWFFRSLEGDSNLQYIFVLAALFVCGWTAEMAGFEPIIGAFMCGLVINPLIPKKSELSHRVEFVGQSLFIPFFLLSVGMLVDLNALRGGVEFWKFLMVFLAIAIGTKWLAAFVYQKIFREPGYLRDLAFGLSTSHAAATIAVVMLGYRAGIVGEEVLNAAIMLIFSSSLIGSLVTDRQGRKLATALRIQRTPSTDLAGVSRILIPLSNPKNLERLLDLGFGMHRNQDRPLLALVVHRRAEGEDEAEVTEEPQNELLERAETYAMAAGVPLERMQTRDFNPARGIVRSAEKEDVTDMILGWNEHVGAAEMLYGTVLQQLLRRVVSGIWVFRQIHPLNTNEDIGIILPPLAGLESGFDRWVFQVLQLAKHLSSQIHIYGNAQVLSDFLRLMPEPDRKSIHLVECELDDALGALEPDMDANDLLILVSAREGTLSHSPKLQALPAQCVDRYPKNNWVVVFPEQTEAGTGELPMVPLPPLPNLRFVRSLILPRSDERTQG